MASTGTLDVPRGSLWARMKTASLPSRLALLTAVLSLLSVIGTYSLQSGLLPVTPTADQLVWLILANSSLALLLAGLMGWRLWLMWRERRSGVAGARLHVRLIGLFAVVAVVPIVVVALFAAVTLNLSVQAWFSKPVRGVLENAAIVANRYQADFENLLKADAEIVSNAIERDPQIFAGGKVDTALLFARLHELTRDRHLLASYLIDAKGNVLGSTIPVDAPSNLQHLKPPSAENIRLATDNDRQVVIDASSVYGQERALIRLPIFAQPIFLLVVRPIDPVVLAYYQQTISALDRYHTVAKMMANTQFIFAALYVLIALLTLLVAVWLGIWAAEELVDPISRLILAAERVAKGDLRAQVPVARGDSEMSRLGRAFNRMTGQLSAQRDELVDASRQIDVRRRFMEAVLAGVSAGVIGLDGDGHIALVNRAAARLLNAEPEEMEGAHYAEAVPELAALIRKAMGEPVARASGEALVKRAGATQTLSVQVDSDLSGGFVVTFDDITDLMSAQRTAAWADVARRIAHEIKNPLTPIQLSAERLKRKYSREIESDPEIFAQCTDTIIRQVGDIGRMVDEFSSFARMPAPVMSPNIFQELLQQSVFLQRVANSDIEYEVRAPKEPVRLICDGRLLSQALTNVLKNAGEAIAARRAKGDDTPGRILATLSTGEGVAVLTVTDNGIGIPAEHRNRLTEPYVTTRAKGTGLGLAIVRKIVEDHGGEIAIGDRSDDQQGAEVRLQFPIQIRVIHALEMEGEHEQERIADRA